MRLASILDDGDLVLAGSLQDGVKVGHIASQMHGHDGRGAVGDGRLDLVGIDLEALGVGVDEDRQGVLQEHGVDRGNEGVRGNDHLVTRLDANGRKCGEEGTSAVGRRHAMLGAVDAGKGRLEPVHTVTTTPEPLAAVQDVEQVFFVALIEPRPAGEGLATDGLAAQQSRFLFLGRCGRGHRQGGAGCRGGCQEATSVECFFHEIVPRFVEAVLAKNYCAAARVKPT